MCCFYKIIAHSFQVRNYKFTCDEFVMRSFSNVFNLKMWTLTEFTTINCGVIEFGFVYQVGKAKMTAWTYCNAEPIVPDQHHSSHCKATVPQQIYKRPVQRIRDTKYIDQGFLVIFCKFSLSYLWYSFCIG